MGNCSPFLIEDMVFLFLIKSLFVCNFTKAWATGFIAGARARSFVRSALAPHVPHWKAARQSHRS